MENKMVWVVESAYMSHRIYTKLFATEEEAQAEYDSISYADYRNMYQTRDIWGWLERQGR